MSSLSIAKKIEKSVCDAIKIYADAQKNAYDRTIQATVIGYQNDKDRAVGKLKLKYQDTYIYAYITDLSTVDIYTKGENVYVNIPNNDMSSEKTVIGLVKKVGDISIVDIDNLYFNQGEDFLANVYTNDNDEYNFINDKHLARNIFLNQSFEAINNNFNSRSSQSFLIQADFFVDININYHLPQMYKIEIGYEGTINGKTKNYMAQLSIDDISGDPYKVGFLIGATPYSTNTEKIQVDKIQYIKQSVLITLPMESSEDEQFYITNFKIKSFKLIGENFQQNDIVAIKNIKLQPVIINNQHDAGFVLRIATDKLKFSEDATEDDTIVLKGILKQDGMLQDLTDVNCYWFEYDGHTTSAGDPTDNNGYDSHGGLFWYCLNPKKNGKVQPLNNNYTVRKKDFLVPNKKFKLVVDYNGKQVSDEITIENNKKDFNFLIQQETNTNRYRGTLIKQSNTVEDANYITKWNLETASGTIIPLTSESTETTTHIIEISTNSFMGKAKLVCDFFIKNTESQRIFWCGQATKELIGEKQLNSIFIENGEQVFLYENNNSFNSPAIEGARYPTSIKQLSVKAYRGVKNSINKEMTNLKYYWLIPNKNENNKTLLIASKNDNIQLPDNVMQELNNYIDYNKEDWIIQKGNTCSFTIAKTYAYHNCDDIYIVAYNEQNHTCFGVNRTNFSFAQEGEPGTANNGVYCRIVPNSLDGQFCPPYVALFYNQSYIMPNYNIPNSDENNLNGIPKNYFKIQVWKQGSKIFDGFEATSPLNTLSWGGQKLSSRNNQIIIYPTQLSESKSGQFTFAAGNFAISNKSEDRTDQWVFGTLSYENIIYQCWLPFILIQTKNNTTIKKLKINGNKNTLNATVNYQEDGYGLTNDGQRNVNVSIDSAELTYSEDNSLLSYCTFDSQKNQLIPTQYYQNNGYDFLTFISLTDQTKVSIPIRLALSIASSVVFESWNDEQNKAIVQSDTGDIFAKRYIGGEKTNGALNGIIAGLHTVNSLEKNSGYMAYDKGHQTFFLNSTNGMATFGNNVAQQVIIEPTQDGGVLKAGSYKISKNDPTIQAKGLEINLSAPSIKYVNSDSFCIDPNGQLTSQNWHITSDYLYKNEDKKSVIGLGANTKTDDTTLLNVHSLKLWSNATINTAMAFWHKDNKENYQSIVTSTGSFIGKELLITAAADITSRIPKVSSQGEGRMVSNGIGLGKISEIVNQEVQNVISLYSKAFAPDSVGTTNLVLNPLHFHFGDTKTFEIKRNGKALFSEIQLTSPEFDSGIVIGNDGILLGESIKSKPSGGHYFWLRKEGLSSTLTMREQGGITKDSFSEMSSHNGFRTSNSFRIKDYLSTPDKKASMILDSVKLRFSNGISLSPEGFILPSICTFSTNSITLSKATTVNNKLTVNSSFTSNGDVVVNGEIISHDWKINSMIISKNNFIINPSVTSEDGDVMKIGYDGGENRGYISLLNSGRIELVGTTLWVGTPNEQGGVQEGITGTFTTADNKKITFYKGIITGVADVSSNS